MQLSTANHYFFLTSKLKYTLKFSNGCFILGEASLKSLDLPVYERQRQLLCKELIGQMLVLVQDFVHGLSSLYTYMEHRLTSYPRDSSLEPLSQNTKVVSNMYTIDLHRTQANKLPQRLKSGATKSKH